MNRDLLPGTDLTPAEAKELQTVLREGLRFVPPPGDGIRLIAGADVSILRGRDVGHGALVVLEKETLRPVDQAHASVRVPFPYVPGLLSFRELPPLAAAWEKLRVRPDVILFDGHGLAHPRRFGLACHGGLLFDAPTIGVAKSILVGEYKTPEEKKGSAAPLYHAGEEVGMVLRTRTGVSPVFVSVGHRMDLTTAMTLVMRVSPCYRIPEPIRRAHRLSNLVRSGRQ